MWVKTWIALVLSVHVGLLAWSAAWCSPTFNELGHVPAGLSHWQYRMFHLYRVNPPLPRMVATLPLLAVRPKTDWSNYGLSDFSREEIPMGVRFARANGADTFRLFMIARWACIPFSLLGALVCYRWGAQLWGTASGLTALTLWSFNPIILGQGPLVMPDVPAAATGLAAVYAFWKWLRNPGWFMAIICGGLLGIALLCKTSLLIFLVVWPAIWLFTGCYRTSRGARFEQSAMLATMILISLYVVNLSYSFVGSFQPLTTFRFQSRMLGGDPTRDSAGAQNRWADTWLARMPVPVPRDYLLGIDQQRTDFEQGDRCYLRGEWKQGGWWYFYLYALAVKTPVGTLGLFALACALALGPVVERCLAVLRPRAEEARLPESLPPPVEAPSSSRNWSNELCLLLPAVAIFGLVSSQTSYTNHFRYVLPAFGFLFVWISRVGTVFSWSHPVTSVATGILILWSVVSSLVVYPHSISYFNELAGGQRNGHAHLLDSNVAWGQDLLFLKAWLEKHPHVTKIGLAAIGFVDPHAAGIESTLPPLGPNRAGDFSGVSESDQLGPRPGWYAIDANFLHGTHWSAATGNGLWQKIPAHGEGANFEYFQRFEAIDRIGGSTFIYHVTLNEANRVRRDLGLIELHDADESAEN